MQRLAAALATAGCLVLAACEPETGADVAPDRADRPAATSTGAGADADVGQGRPTGSGHHASPRCTFRNVSFMVEPNLVLEVRNLVGQLETTGASPATFDDPRTFSISIAEAEVALDMRSLAAMMNDYAYAGPDAPMRDLAVETDGSRLRISGKLHKGVWVPFSMVGEVSATPEGEVKIVPAELHAAGLPVQGLLDFFGIHLEDVVKARDAVGIRLDGDAMFLTPRAILPPPRLDGRIVSVEVKGGKLVQRFGGARAVPIEPRASRDGNTMTFRGGTLRFGHLTMEPTDLTLVDADPKDPFLFSLGDYTKHLVAGYSRTLADGSLVTMMPDYDQADRSLLTTH